MTDWTFHRDQIRTFRFVRSRFDARTGVAQLIYVFDDGPELVETVTVPGAPFVMDDARAAAAQRALRLLHLIAGVSYYKAAVPAEIRIEDEGIDAATAALLELIYRNGLGEFAYRNGLELRDRIRFPALLPSSPGRGAGGEGRGDSAVSDAVSVESEPSPQPLSRGERGLPAALGLRPHALVAIGGGKDSLVSIEALRDAGVEQTVTWIGGSQLIAACAARTGLPTLNIGRQLAPQLFDFNRRGAWNGHIPVTAVNSAILAFAAVLLGVNQVVFSNERSASYGSLIPGTGEVNHQWSKGWAFEAAFGEHLQRHVAADLDYYSLLRPLSELAVARQFAKSDRYDDCFSSCNRNFHILGERPTSRWCGVCPKCLFVFLALAPFLPKLRLVGIVGRNLLDDPDLIPGYDALLEFGNHKPFECVGEGRESRAAMAALAQRPEWREDAVIKRFAKVIAPQLDPAELAVEPLLALHDERRIPAALWERLRDRFAA
ncbi:MAG: endonuclease domain-containing protein [Thermomonas sp.]|uniref:UDP-N-acetyl-alpha-D-muramoyl-L-alanyl-L- glutamate epimerase n=1 Tax=Thermomonas sp. TaxID=1971895 RepID=UPI001D3B045C|nr:UDP-N-acetyl-alpha-D-muramoyl-L-alanyl-L-glutamate epimerase [Thermomonas sp.]MBZ0087434.1 endonuclease domain-containing protein [Thermomonas sp.]